MEIECKSCVWWQDYTNRVTACVKGKNSDCHRNRIELRCCKCSPPPGVNHSYVYTDENYSCGSFKSINNNDNNS